MSNFDEMIAYLLVIKTCNIACFVLISFPFSVPLCPVFHVPSCIRLSKGKKGRKTEDPPPLSLYVFLLKC